MSYNGSGTFSLVAGNPVVTGTTISSTWANNTLNDIATGLSTAITKDGQTTPTANIPMGGYKITGLGAPTVNGDALRYENQTAIIAGIQAQTYTAFTTGGTSTAYTLTPAPVITAYAAGQSWWVTFHAASGAAPTLTVNGVATPPNLVKQIADGTYANIAADDIPVNHRGRVTLLSATQALVALPAAKSGANTDITSLRGASVGYVPVRQTVLSGPVDSSGLPAFGGSTGSGTVTATGTLIVTASNGFVANGGAQNYVGSITDPSWTGLTTNGTMYLYLDIAADGTCTTGSGTLAPNYQRGGTYSTTSGQFTFNVQEMVGKVGDGSAAAQTYRVYVGQVTVAGAVVTVITWYALMGRNFFRQATPAASTTYNIAHGLGFSGEFIQVDCLFQDNTGAWFNSPIAGGTSSTSSADSYGGVGNWVSSNVAATIRTGSNFAVYGYTNLTWANTAVLALNSKRCWGGS